MVGLERGRVGTLRLGARDGHGRQGRDPDPGKLAPSSDRALPSNRITPTSVPPSITKAPSRWATDPRASRKTGRSRSMPSAPSPAAPPTTTIAGLGPCSPMPERQPARSASRSTFTARAVRSRTAQQTVSSSSRPMGRGKAGLLIPAILPTRQVLFSRLWAGRLRLRPIDGVETCHQGLDLRAKARTRSRNRSDQVLQVARILPHGRQLNGQVQDGCGKEVIGRLRQLNQGGSDRSSRVDSRLP